jgi:uncharacterized protein (DUF433 family)
LRTREGYFTLPDEMLDRIKIDPAVCEGKPTIRGMRITVDFVLKLLGDGYNAEDIVREYPELEREDVYQAAKYGAWLASEKTSVLT